jgi:hypothetical protein
MSDESKKAKVGRGLALKEPERVAILTGAAAGISEAELARRTGRSRGAIRRVLKSPDAQQARALAKSVLQAALPDYAKLHRVAAEVAARKGDASPIHWALERTGVVEPKPAAGSGGPAFTVQIGVVLPGLGSTAQLGLSADLAPIEAEAASS